MAKPPDRRRAHSSPVDLKEWLKLACHFRGASIPRCGGSRRCDRHLLVLYSSNWRLITEGLLRSGSSRGHTRCSRRTRCGGCTRGSGCGRRTGLRRWIGRPRRGRQPGRSGRDRGPNRRGWCRRGRRLDDEAAQVIPQHCDLIASEVPDCAGPKREGQHRGDGNTDPWWNFPWSRRSTKARKWLEGTRVVVASVFCDRTVRVKSKIRGLGPHHIDCHWATR